MRISLHTLGTRGDVQPFIALACALRDRGHDVQLAAPAQFGGAASARSIQFAELPGGFLELLDSPEGKAAVAGGQGFSAGFKLLKYVGPLMLELFDQEWEAVRAFQPEMIVAHPKSIAAPHLALALQRPFVLASPIPGFTPTSAYPSPMLPVKTLGPLNRVSHLLMTRSGELLFRKPLRNWRAASLGLPAKGAGARPAATLYAYSRHLLPPSADFPSSVHVTGFWFLDSPEYQPSRELQAFLAAGETPVAVGFGSMPGLDPARLTTTVIEGLALAGKRGVLVAAGGGALFDSGLSPTAFFLSEAPFDWLFKQVSATLHHGGAGTTASSLRAGKPIISCPFMADQPFWSRRLEAAGLGTIPLDRRKLSPEALAQAFIQTDRPEMRTRTEEMARLMESEGGAREAAALIEGLEARPG